MNSLHASLRNGSLARAGLLAAALVGLAGCASVKRAAVGQMADALAGGGSSYASDDDPELIREATPFSLKLMESVLAQTPEHRGLLLACASGFTQYAYGFVLQEADESEAADFARAEAGRVRAKKLFLRAKAYGLRGLEAAHPGLAAELMRDPKAAAARAEKDDVGLLYWTAAAWGGAVSLGKNDPELIAEIPQLESLIDRALALDESWGGGAIHAFLITYEMNRSGLAGDPAERARRHFERAVELSAGRLAGPYVSYAEAVCVERHDAAGFVSSLEKALAIDPDAEPEQRLANLVMQRRARWLLAHQEDLFLTVGQTLRH
jgi:predicted anti-sigma-YlaC factor YlaD